MKIVTTITFDGPSLIYVDDRRVVGLKSTMKASVSGPIVEMETNSFSGTVAEAERLLSWLTGLKVTIQTEVASNQ